MSVVTAMFASLVASMRQLYESVVDRPVVAALGGLAGAVWGHINTALPFELPVIIAIVVLVLIDQRVGVRAARHRGEEIISHVTRTRLTNKLSSYGEMYLVGLAAKTLSPEVTVPLLGEIGVGPIIYGVLMGVIASVETWSILENKYDLGEFPINPEDGIMRALKHALTGRVFGKLGKKEEEVKDAEHESQTGA